MPSGTIRSIEMAHEPTFCNLGASSNGAPSTDGLTFTPIEVIDSSGLIVSDAPLQDSGNGNRAGFYTTAPEAVVDPNGDPIVRGSLTLDFYLRAQKGVYVRPSGSSPMPPSVTTRDLIGTRLKAVCAYEGSIFGEEAADGALRQITGEYAELSTGQLMAVCPDLKVGHDNAPSAPDVPNQIMRYAICTSFTTSAGEYTAKYSPCLTGEEPQMISPLEGFYQPTEGGDPVRGGQTAGGPWATTHAPTVCLRITGDGWQQVCYGCALTALTVGADGDSRAVKCSATVDVAYAVTAYGDFEAAFTPITDGPVLHSLGMAANIGPAYTPPVSPSGHEVEDDLLNICIDSWSLSLSWSTAAISCGNYWVGRGPLEATNLETSLELSFGGTDASSSLLTQWAEGTYRTVIIGFGGRQRSNWATPDQDNDLASFGGCICLPAACLLSGAPAPDLGGDLIKTTVTLGAGPYLQEGGGKVWRGHDSSAKFVDGGFTPSIIIGFMQVKDWQ